jgi:hypothetical protein
LIRKRWITESGRASLKRRSRSVPAFAPQVMQES